jgi:hypothetical protein
MANRRFIDFPIAASVGDNDIVLIWQDGMNKQTTKGTLIQGAPTSLEGLTDVDIAGLINGQILQYNSTTGKWENVDRTDINLSELGDVSIVSPTNGQVLVYNSSTSKWENSSGGYVPYTGAVTTVNLGAQTIQAGSFVKAGGTSSQFLKADGSVDSTAYGTGSVTSVGLTMPSAFSVANNPVTTAGTLAVTATGTTSQYIRGDGSLATFPGLTGFVPYTGATADVNLGTHDLTAERGTFANNGSSDTLTVNHTSGSGYGIIVTKGGNNEALYVSKTSGSGNAMTVVGGRTSLVDLALSSVTNTAGDFLTLSGGVVHKRTAAQTLTDIGGQAALTNPVTGTGTTNQIPKFTGASSLGNSNLSDDGSAVTCSSELRVFGALNGTTASLTSTGTHLSLIRSTFNTFTISVGTASGINGLLFGNNTAGTFPLIISQTNGAATFSSNQNATSTYTIQNTDSTNTSSRLRLDLVGGNSALSFVSIHNDHNYISSVSGKDLYFQQSFGGTTNMTIKSGGNVLIGTTTDAGFKLDVNGTGRFSGALTIGADFFISSSTAAIVFNSSANFNTQIYQTGGSLVLYTGANPRLTIASTGAATFSSSVTAASLALSGTIANSGDAATLTIKQVGTTFTNGIYLERAGERNGYYMYIGGGLDALNFRRNYFGTQSDVMSLTRDGNVGIGTDSPGARLTILTPTSDSTVGFNLRAYATGADGDRTVISRYTSSNDNNWANSVYRAWAHIYETNGSERMRITSGGNVLIGTTTANVNLNGLQVDNASGTNFISINTSTTGIAMRFYTGTSIQAGYILVDGSSTSYVTSSDYRLKEDLQEIKGLEKVSALKVYDFKWKDSENRMDGVLAHELAEVLPYAVSGKKDGEQMQGVDYSKIVPLLIQSIKELKEEIDTLKK